jgi:hypothetical protein
LIGSAAKKTQALVGEVMMLILKRNERLNCLLCSALVGQPAFEYTKRASVASIADAFIS